MSLKRGFWWGKLCGIVAGSVFGGLCAILIFLMEDVFDNTAQPEPTLIVILIFYGLWGGIAGAVYGAIIGTVLGVMIAWTQSVENASLIWLIVWAIPAPFLSLLFLSETNETILILPAVLVWLGGLVGWYSGQLFQSQAHSTPQNAPAAQ